MTAVLCVISPLSIPLAGGVPISLATMAVMLCGALLGPKDGTAATALYLLIGMIGLPVFSGYSGGAAKIFGLTGGFLAGYLPLACMSGLAFMKKRNLFLTALILMAGNALLYALGTFWFVIAAKSTLQAALLSCVVPFLAGDALKIAAVIILAPKILRNMNQQNA